MTGKTILTALIAALLPHSVPSQARATQTDNVARASAALGRLPLYFVENRGVYADEVAYYVQGAEKTLFFTAEGITLRLRGKERGFVVKLDFVGANAVRPRGEERQTAVLSYFKGPERDWKSGLPTFSRIVYADLWPGIDLVYSGTVDRLKYEFVVRPGANPRQIRLRYRGVTKLAVTASGSLRVKNPASDFDDAPPVAHQENDGERESVAVTYALTGKEYGF